MKKILKNIFSNGKDPAAENNHEEIHLKISGMTCDHCATGIEKKFNDQAGVIDKKVSYADGNGVFSYDAAKISKDDIIETIKQTGSYKVKEILKDTSKDREATVEKVTLKIGGMTCDHCATGIEKKFNDKAGVIDKKVSYADGNGEFTYDTSKISKDEITEVINQTGNYKVEGEADSHSDSGKDFDLIIIGGGSAAFSAAIKANELGINTLLVNGGLPIGGTCVNVGCVPSKHLIRAAESIHKASHSPFRGITPNKPDWDYKTIIEQKKELVAEMQKKKYLNITDSLEYVKIIEGWAEFEDAHTIRVNTEAIYTGMKFLIVTGTTTNIPDIEGLKEVGYLTNETLFDLEEQPESLAIIGAGYIGLEIAQAYQRMGTKVKILHRSERILRTQTQDVTVELSKHLQDDGMEIHTDLKFQKIRKENNRVIVEAIQDGQEVRFETSHIAIAAGTKPNTAKLGLETTGLELDVHGHIKVNNKQGTNISHIYAAGDCTNTPAFVYTAALEGNVAVESAFTSSGKETNYLGLPWVVFTDPQVAGAGIDEKEAEEKGIPFEVSNLPLSEIPRAAAALDTRGFIKLIRNPETDQLLGIRVVAPEGGELVMQASLAIKYGITVEELAHSFHPYLTLSEGIKLAAITFNKDIAELSCCAV